MNGELKVGRANFSSILHYFINRKICTYHIGFYPFYGRNRNMEAVEAASAAYNKDRDYGQHMKWWIIKCMENFVTQMKATRQEVVKL
jgi:glyceraldehyde-3-phosphate dehydrogenase (NADP+)